MNKDNRSRTLKALRTNPKGFVQIREKYYGEDNERCAVGLIMEEYGSGPGFIVGLDDILDEAGIASDILIYKWNDMGLSFSEIADMLEAQWKEEND